VPELAFRAAQQAELQRRGAHARRMGFVLGALGFFAFMPYISVNVGNNSAIQAGDAIALSLAITVAFVSWRGRPFWIYPALLAPLCLSTLYVALTGNGDLKLCWKGLIPAALSWIIILPVQQYGPRYALSLLTGIALAILVHVFVGAIQWYAFSQGWFPFTDFYRNVSFYEVREHAEQIAKYQQRPFGLFPEPSAMSSSLAPWVLLWVGEFLGLIQLQQRPSRGQRALFTIAGAGGLGLMILSQSGHTAITLAALLLLAGIWFSRSRATLQNYLAVALAFCIALPTVIALGLIALSSRVGGASDLGNSSWEDRAQSLTVGFTLLSSGSWSTTLFGVGVGHVSDAIWKAAHLEAVWSVLLTYVYETGIFGLIALMCIAAHLLRVWRKQRYDAALAAIAVVWLVGLTLTTSYLQLLPTWVALGWLTVWPAVVEAPQRRKSLAASGAWRGARPAQLLPRDDVRPAVRWSEMTDQTS